MSLIERASKKLQNKPTAAPDCTPNYEDLPPVAWESSATLEVSPESLPTAGFSTLGQPLGDQPSTALLASQRPDAFALPHGIKQPARTKWSKLFFWRKRKSLSSRDDQFSASAVQPVKHNLPNGAHWFGSTYQYHVNLDLHFLRKLGIITPTTEKSLTDEEFRVIKRPLLANISKNTYASDRHANTIVLTSSFSNEGKSFCSINLAISMALEKNSRVLLIDGDIVKNSIAQYLNIQAHCGITDLLAQHNPCKLADAIVKTNIEQFDVIPAGTFTQDTTELFASQTMHSVLETVSRFYSVILLDSPPLLVTTEAAVLASKVGQCILVVEANKTPQAIVAHSLDIIKECPLVSLLLNKNTHSQMGYGYQGYKYGYQAYRYGGYRNPDIPHNRTPQADNER